MREYQPTPEFEDQVRKAVNAPSANTEFINRLRSELARRPVKVRPQFQLKPAWVLAFVAVVLALIASAPTVARALKRLFGYMTGVGLVENTGNLRMLAGPVSVTRDGVTLTITSVFAYADHVELIYDVKGIDPSNSGDQPQTASEDAKAFCGPQSSSDGSYLSDGDAALRLPDGTLVQRMFGNEYPQNVFAMKPVYKVAIPSDVTQLTLVLKCIPWARLGAVPENWEVPFKLVAVPAGMVVGAPVIDANATSQPVATAVVSPSEAAALTVPLASPQVTFTLESVAQLDTGTVFYFHLNMENQDPLLVSIYPRNVYVIDSLGQKIQLMNNEPMYAAEYPVGTTFEYVTTSRPAEGALTLVVEDAVAKYAPRDETTFTFDAGDNPQRGQIWELNQEFDIAGYKVEVASARAVTFSDMEDNPEMWNPQGGPDYPEGSQGFDYGYQFTFKIDPSLGMSNVAMDILSDSCSMSEVRPMNPSTVLYYTQLCRGGYPKRNVKVILRGISVLVKDLGQVVWSPGGARVPATSAPAPTTPNVRVRLERLVPMDRATVFYFSMDMENRDPSLVSLMPIHVYVLDSLGQKIGLIGNFAWEPFEHRVGSPFEFTSESKPADGPLTLVIENAVAYYAPLYVDPPQAMPDQMSFHFDAGENPQYGQNWALNNEFDIAGYKVKVTSARATVFGDSTVPGVEYPGISQGYDYGYDFVVQVNPPVKMQVWLDIISEMSQTPMCWLTNNAPLVPASSSVHYVKLCRGGYPKGNVRVTIGELSILVENAWRLTLVPEGQSVP